MFLLLLPFLLLLVSGALRVAVLLVLLLVRTKLPTWHALVLVVALLQPSSAFMERVFSILRSCFDDRQEHVYSDRICAAALLKYNRGRHRESKGLREEKDATEDGGGGNEVAV